MRRTARVLMSEGSSLSARESLTALGLAGFSVEVVDPSALCLARFSKWCARRHPSPRFGDDPKGYLDSVVALLRREAFDVLYPAHEQAYLFARHRDALARWIHVALPRFEVFERMQSKVGFAQVLDELGLPAPSTSVVWDEGGLREAVRRGPVYVKAAFGTATHGLFYVRSGADLERSLAAIQPVLGYGVVVQRPVEGHLERAQAVFDDGRMVGFHACRQIEEGVSGGDLVKESVWRDDVSEHVRRIGGHLSWHGGLSIDYVVDGEGTPRYIDSNPRLAETGNALATGLNLPELLVRVSLGEHPSEHPRGGPGVRSFMGIQGLLRAARDDGSRRAVLRAGLDLALHRGVFARGSEELTPVSDDPRALIPVAAVAATLMIKPTQWEQLSSATVRAYASTPTVVQFVRAAPGASGPSERRSCCGRQPRTPSSSRTARRDGRARGEGHEAAARAAFSASQGAKAAHDLRSYRLLKRCADAHDEAGWALWPMLLACAISCELCLARFLRYALAWHKRDVPADDPDARHARRIHLDGEGRIAGL